MKINLSKTITRFITEARKRGFSDFQIRQELKRKNYPENLTIKCFDTLQPKFKIKNQICIFLSNEILTSLEKRAKKNLLTIEEQIEDILRRSSIKKKFALTAEKLDDMLLTCFSRSQRGRK